MTARCTLISHSPGDSIVWNEGYYFSKCTRCGHDILRQEGGWKRVPKGYRVVWASGYRRHALPSDFGRKLPALPVRRKRAAKRVTQSVGSVLVADTPAWDEPIAPYDDPGERRLLTRMMMIA